MRCIQTGHGISYSTKSPVAIAAHRSFSLEGRMEQTLFISTFHHIRRMAADLSTLPVDLENACDRAVRHGSVAEAAMVEALASLRAEGVRL